MATAGPRRDAQNYTENVIKQGYLKKSVVSSELITSTTQQIKVNIKQKLEPLRWYVFGVRNRMPYLEYFDKEESVFVGHAIETYDLSRFERLSYTMGTTMPVYSFCIYLANDNIELTAANRAQMIEWCRTLERHLSNLGYKVKRGGDKDDHMYSEFPIKRAPRRTGLEAEMQMEKQVLMVDLGSGVDEEEKENDYEDIPDRKVFAKDAKDENYNDKIPCVPKRPPKLHQAEGNENVFASIYSVSRNGLENSLKEKEEKKDGELAESDSDETFNDADMFRKINGTDHQFSVNENDYRKPRSKWTDVVEDEDRCTSLPNFPFESEDTTGDTSEDTDFIEASFWLRNRKTEDLILFDVTDPQEAKRKLPPQPSDPPPLVPRRSNSAKPQTQRQCFSMDDSLTTKMDEIVRVSPTLELLGQAPKPIPQQRISKLSPDLLKKNFKESNKSDTVVEYNDFKIKSIKRVDKIVTDDLGDDEIGDYEEAPNRIQKDLTNGTESDQGIYEPAWMCKSHRDSSPHKEKLLVEVPDDSKKSFIKGVDDKLDNSAKENIKPKKRFSLRFSRKDKSFKLPEEISVPARNSSTDDENDGNLYTDFPSDNVPKRGRTTPDAATSDICKISLENGPSHSTETSPVLPRRQKVKESSRSSEFHDKGLKHSPPPMPSHNQPPSPPQKSGAKSSDTEYLLLKRDMETPVAPPRRNRKTFHGEILHSPSRETSKPVINPLSQSINTKLYQPKRDLPPVPVDDPPLPPRDEKPALPPPRKGFGSVAVNEDYKPDIPERGGRPKSVNITKRQFSTEAAALTVMNLKQNQVDILRSEIDSTNGLKRTVTKMQFQVGLALVECFERIWIAGWDLKNFPRLYDKFHVGDQLIAINDVHVSEVSFAVKLVKNIKEADTLDVTIKRLPLAKVFALQRMAEGENLGFKRDGGTAEIVYVDPHGIAARHGLHSKAKTLDFVCNWWLTEINMRPLNLFFKDNEIERRLMAVGRDISIVVQPADFVKELRKQLRKMRGYKDYLVQ